jgi:hypothetical protein
MRTSTRRAIFKVLHPHIYQTWHQILLSIERFDEDIDPMSLRVTLCQLKRQNLIDHRVVEVSRQEHHSTRGTLRLMQYKTATPALEPTSRILHPSEVIAEAPVSNN